MGLENVQFYLKKIIYSCDFQSISVHSLGTVNLQSSCMENMPTKFQDSQILNHLAGESRVFSSAPAPHIYVYVCGVVPWGQIFIWIKEHHLFYLSTHPMYNERDSDQLHQLKRKRNKRHIVGLGQLTQVLQDGFPGAGNALWLAHETWLSSLSFQAFLLFRSLSSEILRHTCVIHFVAVYRLWIFSLFSFFRLCSLYFSILKVSINIWGILKLTYSFFSHIQGTNEPIRGILHLFQCFQSIALPFWCSLSSSLCFTLFICSCMLSALSISMSITFVLNS